ncbi:unnamed protein product [Caenorhabditis auriculariae]|uniref:Fibronectin type-III domain-containing protein n=1 Tax=Caenorhabditis auriculariae TaxID=2777116 RepID=A0A8S1GY87_9PELO|nr:unnamed protein product [Caenorhabditis auriculariae]
MRLIGLFCLFSTCSTFVVLPYIQIDFAHMYRVAQCKAKCAEKYGKPAKRDLLDGSQEEFFDVTSEDNVKCELGCQHYIRGYKKSNLTGSTLQGAKFWVESSAHTGRVGSSPISSVELLCQSPSTTYEMLDTYEGIIGLSRTRSSGPVQFVVQWKQRTYALGYYDESQWITASSEPDTLIKVEGLIPGVQYKFMISVIGPAGKLGETISSEWAEITSTVALKAPGGPLVVKNGYNSEQGVIAHVHFPRTAYDSCHYRLYVRNETGTVERDITVDPTVPILLPDLEFDSTYTVSLAALSTDGKTTSSVIASRFNSFQCRQVYGKGSIHCAPDPVTDIKVALRPNGTALISWTPSAEVDVILTYQVTHQAISGPCSQKPVSVYLSATSTQHELLLPRYDECQFLVRIINYDAIGREAQAETQISVDRPLSLSSQTIFQFPLVAITIVACLVILCIGFILCCHCRCSEKCPARISEKHSKVSAYP